MFFELLHKISFGRAQKNVARRQVTHRLRFDCLEDRRLLAVTRFVDDSFAVGQVDSTHFTSIQAAVSTSVAGDTIQVAPGVYNESVTVDKTLSIIGAQTSLAATRTRNSSVESILDPTAAGGAAGVTSGFNLQADNIKIQGFTIADNFGGLASLGNSYGITTSRQFSGYQIQDNVIEENTLGIYLNAGAANQSLIERNVFRGNNEDRNAVDATAAAAVNPGVGIFSDQGLFNVSINTNFFTNQSQGSIVLLGGGTAANAAMSFQASVFVLNNTLVNDAGIIFSNTTSSRIANNSFDGSSSNGILFAGGVNRVDVTNNVIRNVAFSGISLSFLPGGLDNGAFNVEIPDFLNFVSGNTIDAAGDAGIRLRGVANGNTITGNTVTNTRATSNEPSAGGLPSDLGFGDGITLEGAAYNTVTNNTVRGNAGYGIGILQDGASSSLNTFNPHGTSSFNNIVSGNTATQNGLDGFEVIGDGEFDPGVANSLQNNTAQENRRNGFGVQLASGVVFTGNSASSNLQDGVQISNSQNNTINSTTASQNTRDGIRLDLGSVTNTLTGNNDTRNSGFDYFDDSTGSGTANTGNTFTGNRGQSQNVDGLLSR